MQGTTFLLIDGGPSNAGCYVAVTTAAKLTTTLTDITITNSTCPSDGISLSYLTNPTSTTNLQNLWLSNVSGTGRGVAFTQQYGYHQANNLVIDV